MLDIMKLKELASRVGGILVMDGNTPEFVILPYEKYAESAPEPMRQEPQQQPSQPQQSKLQEEDQALIDTLNREISALKEEIRQKEATELAEPREI